MAVEIQTVRELTKKLSAATGRFEATGSEASRIEAMDFANSVIYALDRPEDAVLRLVYTPSQFLSVKLGVDLGLFKEIVVGSPITLDELAEKTAADSTLIGRIVRNLCAMKYVDEDGAGVYRANTMTHTVASHNCEAAVNFIFLGMPTLAKVPEYLKKTGYKNPSGATGGLLQYAENTGLTYWEWLARDPENMKIASKFFEANGGARPQWVDWFPVQQELLDGFSGDPARDHLLVEVAGGRGRDVTAFLDAFPNAPGRIVLQDVPHVINNIEKLDPRIEMMHYDFFKEQPVTGARIYRIKNALHNWSDEDCRVILKNIAKAMKKGYSKLIIDEFALPDQDCPAFPTTLDLMLMVFCTSWSRTKRQWVRLLASAGLRLVKVWPPPGDGWSAIECEVAL